MPCLRNTKNEQPFEIRTAVSFTSVRLRVSTPIGRRTRAGIFVGG
jgi:hypothetical protein